MDIVERLRSYRPPYGWPEEYSIIVEPTLNHVAADEIERLRDALQKICDGQRDADRSYAELFAEVKIEARTALKEKK